MTQPTTTTFGALKESGYQAKSIKEEIRINLIAQLKSKENGFKGIIGYEETVMPDLQTALLSRHNLLFLGLRGQAKTRMARLLINLLDEYIPYIQGSELYDDPFAPLSWYGRDIIEKLGDGTPIAWLHRSERYTEKLATPDVSIADLVGDVDPIKAATLKLPYSDERVIHYGLIPRSHRGIFVINELPDLQPRIQVALFNILQEGDIQIRGFKLRLPLDIQFVFTANPEDYTNRGSIVTPLKDRIESQILTHYPKSIEVSREITAQEARLTKTQQETVQVHPILKDLIEQIAFEARDNEYIDKKSGVSARLTISAYENLVSTAERRAILLNETKSNARIADLWGIIPAITGKIELVYEGEQEGPGKVAHILMGRSLKKLFLKYFPNPEETKKKKELNPYKDMINYFAGGNTMELYDGIKETDYVKELQKVKGLAACVEAYYPKADAYTRLIYMELLLHGLAEHSLVAKTPLIKGFVFKDIFSTLINNLDLDNVENEEDTDY